MIKRDDSPVAWSLLMHELEDAKEHLASLIQDLENDPDCDEIDFGIQLGHIYSHLNRAWNRRNCESDLPEEEWEKASQFPRDLNIT